MKFIAPVYLQEFKCDGSLCGSYCCKQWKIIVDENTKEKYAKLPVKEREKIYSFIGEKEEEFYPLKLNKDGSCPFCEVIFYAIYRKILVRIIFPIYVIHIQELRQRLKR